MTKEAFDAQKIKKELKIHAKALQIPSGAADIIIEQTIIGVKKTLSHIILPPRRRDAPHRSYRHRHSVL
jgi:hypothetical protein